MNVSVPLTVETILTSVPLWSKKNLSVKPSTNLSKTWKSPQSASTTVPSEWCSSTTGSVAAALDAIAAIIAAISRATVTIDMMRLIGATSFI